MTGSENGKIRKEVDDRKEYMDDYIGPCVFDFCIQKCDAVHRGGRIKERNGRD